MRPDENVKEMMGYYLQCYLIALGRKTIENQSFKKLSTGIAITTTRGSVWFMAPMQLQIIAHSLLLNNLGRMTKHNRLG